LRILLVLALVAGLVVGGAYLVAGRASGPALQVVQPSRAIGASGGLEIAVETPAGALSRLSAELQQEDRRVELFTLESMPPEANLTQEAENRLRATRSYTRRELAGIQPGPVRLVVTASRPVMFGLRTTTTTVTQDLQARFDPPRISVLSTHHYINHGGSEMVVYRVTPADVESGVRVGEIAYPGFRAAAAGVAGADEHTRVAFFALLHDQDVTAPIELYALDEAGNTGRASLDFRVFRKPFRRSRIELDDRFLRRIVPAILEHSPDLDVPANDVSGEDLLPLFLRINGELRQRNNDTIASFARETLPQKLWDGPFVQLGSSKVESSFADYRTYFHGGREVDRQVHLGFDLAVTAAVPITAANRGRVVFADYLGIYGNTVILDHGMGVQSLYAHLSSIDVKPGDGVGKQQPIGRSGMTGLAGGDHLHFTMLVNGQPVNPVDWWSSQWVEDRILRKLREAGLQQTSKGPGVFFGTSHRERDSRPLSVARFTPLSAVWY
jgi:murein DD-endopeptidase MepM/ murein hydrolase activator NlpD